MPDFPVERFRRLSLPDEDIAEMQRQFDRSDLLAQTSLVAAWAAQPDPELAEHVEELRAAGLLKPRVAAPEPEPVVPAYVPPVRETTDEEAPEAPPAE